MPNEHRYVSSATCNKVCPHCRAWDRRKSVLIASKTGVYVVQRLQTLPEDIAFLYLQRAFLHTQCKYDGLFAFTALGASPSPTWTQPSYPSMPQLHGRAHHRTMDSFRGQHNERPPAVNKARVCIYDAVMMQQAESAEGVNCGPRLDSFDFS